MDKEFLYKLWIFLSLPICQKLAGKWETGNESMNSSERGVVVSSGLG